MKQWIGAALGAALMASGAQMAQAEDLAFASYTNGASAAFLNRELANFAKQSGHTVKLITMPSSSSEQFAQYRLWLAAGNQDVDVYNTDVVWAPQLAEQFIDLTEAMKDRTAEIFPSIVASQTVNGKLVAMPYMTDAPAFYYRKDLLEKYGKPVPKTWDEMTKTAAEIQAGERKAGAKDMWGFVFQGAAYEGLTCDALEWIASSGGGHIVETDGTISINNEKAAAALDRAHGWVGTISPPGVLAYQEEESRGVWQTGNSVFMRNWPYAYTLGNGGDSAVKGKFDVAPLPAGAEGEAGASTLGGWNMAVPKYSKKQKAAIELVRYLSSDEVQKRRAIELSNMPVLEKLYDDKDIAAALPFMPAWKPIFQNAVPRPSATTKVKYNEVSSRFWTAVHSTLSGNGTGAENLEKLEIELTELQGGSW
ncbi:ABC transporter substrate-binding protein [Rhizobium rhizosphaerae]|uniref:ABC transporter substrate-binding protein n=1 Tax=Xaviernesmea rhizosphaerae TaxID=1672749 RepID=A0ABX3PGK7_9HYPH|nr:ABC transporter substrate-binding protein [Xaviernesmea rhizosphaerae]OQP87190.1 ABC transporter substrate-binding protein [Xaviernesmea rhizosphaerae]